MSQEVPRNGFFSARGRAGRAAYLTIRFLTRTVMRWYLRVRVIGEEKLEITPPVILAPVHRSNLDAPLVGGIPDWQPRALSKESLFDNPVLAWIITALGSFPVRREAADREAMKTAEGLLAAGEPLLVFPEGTRQVGREVGEVFDGTAYMAMRTNCPIIPVGVAGTDVSMPSGARLPRRSRVTVVIGDPLVPPATEGRVRRREVKAFTARLREELQNVQDRAWAEVDSR